MQIYRMPGAVFPRVARVVALGFFDGMHLGHTALLSAARREARRRACPLAVFTFADDGSLKPGALRLLSERERLDRLSAAGVDEVFLYSFSALRGLSPEAFFEDVLAGALSATAVACGYNFHFGAGGAGDTACLAALATRAGMGVITLPAVAVAGQPVSASAIRAALAAGDAEGAARLLGRPYAISGTVAHGKALGHTIGVPTANLPISPGMALPALGVYAAVGYLAGDGRPLPGVANIGVRPTVEHGSAPNCETHFLTPVGDIYGRDLTVHLLCRLRGEQQFENLEALCAQIARDKAKAKEYIEQWLNGQN